MTALPMQTEQTARPGVTIAGGHRVLIEERYGWRRLALGQTVVWIKGALSDKAVSTSLRGLPSDVDVATLRDRLRALRGHFAIVAVHPDWVCAAVDRVRSIPLVWTDKNGLRVAQEGGALLAHFGAGQAKTDRDQALAIALSGYTIGSATLYGGVKALLPGQFLFWKNGVATTDCYHRFAPWEADQAPGDIGQERRRLADLTLEILQDLIDGAGGRTIAIPLSAGLDSRLLAAGLKHLGYKNVLTFAYGQQGNHEAETSRTIADRLGYPWHFVPFTNRAVAEIFASGRYADYRAYADSLTAVHFPQDFPAVTALMADGRMPEDSLLVNGQSGDFISGNHIPASLETPPAGDRDARLERVVDALIAKHFKQWRFLMRDPYLARIRELLRGEISALTGGALPDDPACDYGVYEASEFVDRQSKYVVNGQRLYEFLGIDWSLPLWHDRYLEYWSARPAAQKAGQRLYREMLIEANWGDVWRDIPVNAKRIRPRWIIPVRFACKVLHAPFGKARWHEFERRVFEYRMAPLCTYASRRWIDIATDRRGPWTGLCPHIEDYLLDHGVSLDSLAESATH